VATTLDTLVVRTRRFARDYPLAVDALAVSLSNSGTTAIVTDTSLYPASGRVLLEIGTEALVGRTLTSASLTVTRSYAGTTAVSYASATSIAVNPAFLAVEIIDALNAAKDEMYPYIYKPILDTSLTADATTYEFTVPSTIKHLASVEIAVTGDTAYRPMHNWQVRRASTPKLQFRAPPPAGTIRLHGFGPFDDVTAGGSLDDLFPVYAEDALVLSAAARLASSGEMGRVRQDIGLRDDREAANRVGSSISLANQLERRFEKTLARVAQPPMPHHVRSVF
jgi:hypothetical protein